MNRLFKSRSGFTLIETIIYTIIVVMIVVVSVRVMLTVMGAREKTKTVSEVQQDLRFSMDRMVNSVIGASAINTGSSVFDNDNGILSLEYSGSSLDPVIYSLSNSGVVVQEGGGSATPVTSSGIYVDQLRFTNLTATGTYGTIKIQIHATDGREGTGGDKTYEDEMSLQTSVSLRQ